MSRTGRFLRDGRARWSGSSGGAVENPLLASLIAAVIVLGGALTVGSMVLAYRAAARAEAGRRQLVLMNVAAASERMDEGDFLRALPRLGEALKLDEGDPAREEGHRYRLGSVLGGTPRIIQLCPHDGIVTSARFSSDGQHIVTACADGKVRVWDLTSTEPVAPAIDHGDFVDYAEFNAQGTRVVTAGRDGRARVWDARTAAAITPPLRHPGGVPFATFSPDGRRVATAGWDGTARVWDAETGGPVRPPLVHSYRVSYVAFSPDGSMVASGSDDGTAGLGRNDRLAPYAAAQAGARRRPSRLEPRRQTAGHGGVGRDGAGVGYRHGARGNSSAEARPGRLRRFVQPGRNPDRDGELGWNRPDLGCENRRAADRSAQA